MPFAMQLRRVRDRNIARTTVSIFQTRIIKYRKWENGSVSLALRRRLPPKLKHGEWMDPESAGD